MTRINVGVHPQELPRTALLAEHREITRIVNAVTSGRANTNRSNIPDEFTLGQGHVRFFYNKLNYLHDRYIQLYMECKRRGYEVTNKAAAWDNVASGGYTASPKDRELVVQRLTERGHTLRNTVEIHLF